MYANRLSTLFYVRAYIDMSSDRQEQEGVQQGYNPNSIDAAFARLFNRMDNQDATLLRIEGKVEGQGEKLEKLESERKFHWGMSVSGLMAFLHHIGTQLFGR